MSMQDKNINNKLLKDEVKKTLQLELFNFSNNPKKIDHYTGSFFYLHNLAIRMYFTSFFDSKVRKCFSIISYDNGISKIDKNFFSIVFYESNENKKNIFSIKKFTAEVKLIDFKTFFIFFRNHFSITNTAKLYNIIKNILYEFCKEKNISFSIDHFSTNDKNFTKNKEFNLTNSEKQKMLSWFYEKFFEDVKINIKNFYLKFYKDKNGNHIHPNSLSLPNLEENIFSNILNVFSKKNNNAIKIIDKNKESFSFFYEKEDAQLKNTTYNKKIKYIKPTNQEFVDFYSIEYKVDINSSYRRGSILSLGVLKINDFNSCVTLFSFDNKLIKDIILNSVLNSKIKKFIEKYNFLEKLNIQQEKFDGLNLLDIQKVFNYNIRIPNTEIEGIKKDFFDILVSTYETLNKKSIKEIESSENDNLNVLNEGLSKYFKINLNNFNKNKTVGRESETHDEITGENHEKEIFISYNYNRYRFKNYKNKVHFIDIVFGDSFFSIKENIYCRLIFCKTSFNKYKAVLLCDFSKRNSDIEKLFNNIILFAKFKSCIKNFVEKTKIDMSNDFNFSLNLNFLENKNFKTFSTFEVNNIIKKYYDILDEFQYKTDLEDKFYNY